MKLYNTTTITASHRASVMNTLSSLSTPSLHLVHDFLTHQIRSMGTRGSLSATLPGIRPGANIGLLVACFHLLLHTCPSP